MMKYIFLFVLLIKVFFGESQTFKYANGAVIGNQTVISVPDRPAGYAMKQALAYFPTSYATDTKKRPLLVFLHGAGQAGSMDISQLNGDGLPLLLSQGLKPTGIDPITGEVVEWIVVSPHCTDNSGCSFAYPQLQYTIPYLLKTYRIDTSCVWVSGLSAGGAGTWSSTMGDTILQKLITGILPESNGGMDNWITITSYKNNLINWAKKGGVCFYIIGSQDPGDNPDGYGAYSSLMKQYCLPGRYADSVVLGGIHDSRVWNQPWPLTARVFSKTMNAWTQMWSMRKNVVAPPVVTHPPVVIPPVTPPKPIPYPVRIIVKFSDSSCSVIYTHP